mmetsp:Transcript_31950/g.66675  ORF Transcript_31950/g.66675 Transcript_31950/m.66675 type:complete len:104 (-) Transcript_31950:21-332(-)
MARRCSGLVLFLVVSIDFLATDPMAEKPFTTWGWEMTTTASSRTATCLRLIFGTFMVRSFGCKGRKERMLRYLSNEVEDDNKLASASHHCHTRIIIPALTLVR